MAVFYDIGGGDIYGGPDRTSVLKRMQEDSLPGMNFSEYAFEIMPNIEIEHEDGTKSTLAAEYEGEVLAQYIGSRKS